MTDQLKTLPWDDFRLVTAVADRQGLPAAAEQLGVSHSTVFRRLAQIEEALGAKLFERHRRGFVPTPIGEEMVELGQRMDEEIAAFARRAMAREISPAGELRVTTNDSLLVHLMTPLFARFRSAYPQIRLDIVLANRALNLSKRDADVAIRATDAPPENLVGRRVARIAWALYGSSAETASGSEASDGALFGRNWVSLDDDFAGLNVVRFVQRHVPPERIVYRVNAVLGLARAIESAIGIGYLPCFIGDAHPALSRLSDPQPDFAADLWLLTHPDMRHSPRVRVFLDFLATEIARQRNILEGDSTVP